MMDDHGSHHDALVEDLEARLLGAERRPSPSSSMSTPFIRPPPSPVVAGYAHWCGNSRQAPQAQAVQTQAVQTQSTPPQPHNDAALSRSTSLWYDSSLPLPVPWMNSGGNPPRHARDPDARDPHACDPHALLAFLSRFLGRCCVGSRCVPKILPCCEWLATYNWRDFLLADLIAGISVAVMLIPQAMSYASIAGLPHVYGLYGSLAPVVAYAVFGSSRHLAVGPAAVTSLLLSNGLRTQVPGYIDANITNPNELKPGQEIVQEAYNHRAIQLSMVVGILYSSLGLLRLGFLTNFLSHSVISGFTSGSAIIIALTQMKYFVGYQIQASPVAQEQIRRYLQKAHLFRWQEMVMGLFLLSIILTMKTLGKRHKRLMWLRPLGPVTCCLVGKLVVTAGSLSHHGIDTLGAIVGGVPKVTVTWWFPLQDFDDLLPLAAVVMLVDLMESTSIARALSHKTGQNLNSNQEIFGLGVANFVGAACNSYTTTGSFSRSAVNYDAGAQTQMSGLFSALTVTLFLAFGTEWFHGLPKVAVGAVVINSVTGLFEFDHAVHLFKVNKLDWVVWMCSFLSTLFVGVEVGLVISVALALLIVIYHSAFPHTAVLGRIPNSRVYRNVEQYPDAVQVPGMLICRVDAPIYFANIAWVQERLTAYLEASHHESPTVATTPCNLQVVALDLSPVYNVDAAGVRFFHDLITSIHDAGLNLALCNPNTNVVDTLQAGGVLERLGRRWVFVRVHDAVVACRGSTSRVGLAGMDGDGTGGEEVTGQGVLPRRTIGNGVHSAIVEQEPLLG